MINSNDELVRILNEQRGICDRFNTAFDPPDLGLNMGIAKNTNTTSGWYLWAGKEPSQASRFL